MEKQNNFGIYKCYKCKYTWIPNNPNSIVIKCPLCHNISMISHDTIQIIG